MNKIGGEKFTGQHHISELLADGCKRLGLTPEAAAARSLGTLTPRGVRCVCNKTRQRWTTDMVSGIANILGVPEADLFKSAHGAN